MTTAKAEFENRWRDWSGGPVPDVFAFLDRSPTPNPREEAEILLVDLWYRHRNGLAIGVEEYLTRRPAVRDDPALAAELVVEEIGLREDGGERPDSEEYERRLPELAVRIREHLKESPRPTSSSEGRHRGDLTDLIGGTVGKYEIAELIGRGGMGCVFRGVHRILNRDVAIKFLGPELIADDVSIRRFLREMEVAATLLHPNVVTTYDADEHDGRLYYVMEYVRGSDLASFTRRKGGCTEDESIEYVRQAANGLGFAHGHGVVHRDVKPHNLLVDEHGTVKVLDMGLASARSAGVSVEELTVSGQIMGTVDFMAPEQAVDTRNADARSDVYALGCTLYFLRTGDPIHPGGSLASKLFAHRDREPPDLPGSRELNAVFRRMVAKRPEDRFRTMQEVVDALDAVRGRGGDSGHDARPWSVDASTATFAVVATEESTDRGDTVPDVKPLLRCVLTGHEDRIVQPRWSGNGRRIATPSDDGTVRIWNGSTTDCEAVLEMPGEGEVGSVAWSPDGRRIAAAASGGVVHVWDVVPGRIVARLEGHEGCVRSVDWSHDGRLASVGDDRSLRLWSAEDQRELTHVITHTRLVCVRFASTGTLLAVSGDDGCVKVLRGGRFETVQSEFRAAEDGHALHCAWSRDDTRLAVAASDGNVSIWDPFTGSRLATLAGHRNMVGGIDYSFDRKYLASKSSRDGTVRIWSADDGSILAVLEEAGDPRIRLWHSGLAFHPALPRLATLGPGDRVVRVWDLETP